jgi:hypothetical protein
VESIPGWPRWWPRSCAPPWPPGGPARNASTATRLYVAARGGAGDRGYIDLLVRPRTIVVDCKTDSATTDAEIGAAATYEPGRHLWCALEEAGLDVVDSLRVLPGAGAIERSVTDLPGHRPSPDRGLTARTIVVITSSVRCRWWRERTGRSTIVTIGGCRW